ncbi:hypothetical protein EGW08_017547 [Elysia chlorotica]|uniref:Uncharacterized protein n=1 Tax=Elysia chlorotica TaxID=188477 RepID=A0A3S0ZH23_ELYCH|nr:hypothetical protein EGW08_017547 [Elysia chlorotica]
MHRARRDRWLLDVLPGARRAHQSPSLAALPGPENAHSARNEEAEDGPERFQRTPACRRDGDKTWRQACYQQNTGCKLRSSKQPAKREFSYLKQFRIYEKIERHSTKYRISTSSPNFKRQYLHRKNGPRHSSSCPDNLKYKDTCYASKQKTAETTGYSRKDSHKRSGDSKEGAIHCTGCNERDPRATAADHITTVKRTASFLEVKNENATLTSKLKKHISPATGISFNHGGDFCRLCFSPQNDTSTICKVRTEKDEVLPVSSNSHVSILSNRLTQQTVHFTNDHISAKNFPTEINRLSNKWKRTTIFPEADRFTKLTPLNDNFRLGRETAQIGTCGSDARFSSTSRNSGHGVGSKRKRAVEEADAHIEAMVACEKSCRLKTEATVRIRHPRSRRVRDFGWSSNARHHRSTSRARTSSLQQAVASFDLGAGTTASFCGKKGSLYSSRASIRFSPEQSPCQSVVSFSPKSLVPNKECNTTQYSSGGDTGSLSKDSKHDDANRRGACDLPCKRKRDNSPKPLRMKDGALRPTAYHAYFKPDHGQPRNLKKYDEGRSRANNSTHSENFFKWEKCLTVDRENNIKCMVSLSDCALNHTPFVRKINSQERLNNTSDYHSPKKLRSDENQTAVPKSPSIFDNVHELKSSTGKTLPSPARHKRKLAAPLLSGSDAMRSPVRDATPAPRSFSSDDSGVNEESQDTLANFDILKAPIVCPVQPPRPRPHVVTPPVVSLESRQLVYLYRLALKKVGVGFRMTPVDPNSTHIPLQRLAASEQGLAPTACKHRHPRHGNDSVQRNHNLNFVGNSRQISTRDAHLQNCRPEVVDKVNRVYPRQSRSPRARGLGKFCNESLFVLSSPSESSRAPRASPGHTNRSALNANSPGRLLNPPDTPHRDAWPETNKNRGAYQFTSSSPKRQRRGNSRKSKENLKEYGSLPRNRELPTNKLQIDGDMTPRVNRKQTVTTPHTKYSTTSLKSTNYHVNASKGVQTVIDKALKSPGRLRSFRAHKRKQSLFGTEGNPGPKPKEQCHIDASTLNRLEHVVERLSQVLKIGVSPGGRTATNTNTIKTKSPVHKPHSALENKTPRSKLKRDPRRFQETSQPSLSYHQNRKKFFSNFNQGDCSIGKPNTSSNKCRTQSSSNCQTAHALVQPKVSKRKVTQPEAPNLTSPTGTTKSKKEKCVKKTGSRFGPPQLRTAARAAAKTSAVDPDTARGKGPAKTAKGDSTKRTAKKRAKSSSSKAPIRKNMRSEESNLPQAKQNSSVGIQWPSLNQEHPHSGDGAGYKELRRSPKNHHAHTSDKLAHLLAPTEHVPCGSVDQRSSPPPRQRAKATRADRVTHQGRPSSESILTSSLSWFLSVDTSWDVSASQVFD